MNSNQVYISGALTMFDRKNWYEEIGRLVDSLGYYAYVPHLHIDSEKNVTSKQIYETDMRELEQSFLVIADVSCPSLGVGAELERSNAKEIPVILIYKKDHIASDFVQGITKTAESGINVVIEKTKVLLKKNEDQQENANVLLINDDQRINNGNDQNEQKDNQVGDMQISNIINNDNFNNIKLM